MEARGARPSSYRSLLAFTGGHSEPSLDWLSNAAELLGVRAAWLAWEQGPQSLDVPDENRRDRLVAAADSELAGFAALPAPLVDALSVTLARALGPAEMASQPEQTGRAVGKALSACVRAFGLRPSSLAPEQLAGIVGASLPLLSAVAGETGERARSAAQRQG